MLHWVHIYPFDVSYVHCGFFKASDSGINVLSAPWFDMCTVWFVASLIKLYKHDFEVMKYIRYVMPTRAISGL